MNKEMLSFYTYNLKRKCTHCGKPIADQEHGTKIFCTREVLPDSSIICCKDDYHFLKNKEKNAPFLRIATFHKDMHQRIEKLLIEKGDSVTTEQITQYGIRLDMPVRIETTKAQKAIFYFIGFCITQINKLTFKITTHENNF